MAKLKTKTTKAPARRSAQSREEAEALLGDIGNLKRLAVAIELELNQEMAAVRAKHEGALAPINDEIEAKFEALQDWAEANRAELLKDGGKTAALATGELLWRMPPPKVDLKGLDVVIERLHRLGLDRFLRTKEEVNKEAILAEPEAVAGVTGIKIVQVEQFIAKPHEVEVEIASTSRKAER